VSTKRPKLHSGIQGQASFYHSLFMSDWACGRIPPVIRSYGRTPEAAFEKWYRLRLTGGSRARPASKRPATKSPTRTHAQPSHPKTSSWSGCVMLEGALCQGDGGRQAPSSGSPYG
ncbi:MAG: hypothetical protein WAN86_05980, partial [Hyphomicrobiaceae bacterium]